MPEIKKKRAPAVDSNQRAWAQVYDDMNDVINSVNQKSAVESRNGAAGLDGDIRLFKDVDKTKYFIEGKFNDGWAKRELLFSDLSNETQDESINYTATESYVKPDGTVPFTAKQSGVAPTNTTHLSTKGYTDVGRLISVTKSTNNLVFGMTDTASNITFAGFGSNAYNSTTIPTTFVSSLTNSDATGQTLIAASTGSLYRLGGGDNITITTDDPGGGETWVQIDCDINTSNFLTQTVPRASGIRTFDTDAYTGTQTYASGAYIVIDHDESNVTATFSTITLADNSTAPSVRLNASGFLASNHAASGVTNTRITNWDAAHGWGNHASQNYLKKLEDTAATSGSLPSGHYALIEDYGVSADTAKIYNVASADSRLAIEDAEDGSGNAYIKFTVADQSANVNRFHAIYTEDEENNTTSTGTAGGADAIVFQDTATTTWTTAAPVNDKVEVSLVVDHPANTNTTYSVSVPASTTKLRLTAGGSGSGTDDIEFVGSGATSVARTTDSKFTISSSDTNTTDITSSNATTGDYYSLREDGDTVRALKQGAGIALTVDGSATDGDAIQIASTVDVSGLLTNGLYLVEAYQDDAVTTTATASGADKLRFIETDDIEWVISGPSTDVITITPTINFPADNNTWRPITAGSNTLGSGETLAFTAGTNVSITESAGAVTINSSYTNTTYSAGALLDLATTTFNVDLSELTDMTQTWVNGSDEFVVLDSGTQKRKLSSEIFGSNAFNSTSFLTGISSTGTTDESGTPPRVSLLDDSSTICVLEEGTGISIEASAIGGLGNTVKISSTVDTSGLLTNGIYLIEAYETDAVTTTATASGADKLRFIETDDIEWVISGPTSDTITITPTINFPADNNTTYSAGSLLDLATTTFNVDLSEATDMTETWVTGSDEFIVLDSGVQKRKLSSEIFGSNAFNSTAFTTNTGTVTGTGSTGYYARWTGTSGLEGRTTTEVRSDLGIADNEIIDWTSDQGSTNIHSGNYTDTNTTDITSTNVTTTTGTNDFYTLLEDSDTIRALREGSGINIEIDGGASGGDAIKISSTVDTSGLLTNGLYLVEAYEDDAVTTTATASGADKLRFIETDDIEWVISGPSSDVITITPTINFPADANTWRGVTAGGNTLGSGETLAFTAGSNVTITESGGAVTINSSYTDTNTDTKWDGGTASPFNASTGRTSLGLTGNSNTTHYHDARYYTETESDGRFANLTSGATFTTKTVDFNGRDNSTSPCIVVNGTGVMVNSSAAIQCKGGVRVAEWFFIQEHPTNSNKANAVGLRYANDNLTVYDAGQGDGQENFHVPGDVIAYKSSDPRLKTNKEELESPLYKLSKIKGYKFDWIPEAKKYNSFNKGTDIGVMSDEVELMYPELVQTRSSGYKAVDYEKLTAVLIAAVNDLTSKLIEKGVLDEELQSSKICCKANSRKN